jgi:hypothetical protein
MTTGSGSALHATASGANAGASRACDGARRAGERPRSLAVCSRSVRSGKKAKVSRMVRGECTRRHRALRGRRVAHAAPGARGPCGRARACLDQRSVWSGMDLAVTSPRIGRRPYAWTWSRYENRRMGRWQWRARAVHTARQRSERRAATRVAHARQRSERRAATRVAHARQRSGRALRLRRACRPARPSGPTRSTR